MKHFIKLSYLMIIVIILSSCGNGIISSNSSHSVPEHILKGYFVLSIEIDKNETAWIGTFKQGLIKFDENAFRYDSNNSIISDLFRKLGTMISEAISSSFKTSLTASRT